MKQGQTRFLATRGPAPARYQPQMAPGAGSTADARRAAYRSRHTSLPAWWAALTILGGVAAHALHSVAVPAVGTIVLGAVMVAAVRHLDARSRVIAAAAAFTSVVFVPLIAWLGPGRTLFSAFLIIAAVLAIGWIAVHRPRPVEPEPEPEHSGDQARWDKLAKRRRWSGRLERYRPLPSGGRQWRIVLDGSETHIGDVIASNRSIAAAWDAAQTEAYAEPSPDGVESTGVLTILGRENLAVPRMWNGMGADPQTGVAVIGRFADGSDAHIRFYARMDGVRHGLIAGSTGSGKTYLLDELVRIALLTGTITPVILDPQEGQSLPQWRGRVPYAAGADECMAMLAGLHAGMMQRSRRLASMRWTDADGDVMTGMDFYDPFLSGVPAVLIIGDEIPLLLTSGGRSDMRRTSEAVALVKNIGKLGRKTGVAFWPVAQVPSLEELGSQVVRSMLASGNIVSLRTQDHVSAGMLGLEADPSQLPRYFRDGSPTYGLGYVVGPDQRQAPARIDMVPPAMRKQFPEVPPLDDMMAEAIGKAMDRLRAASAPPPTLAPAGEVPDEDGPPGRTAADAVRRVLENAGRPLSKADIATQVRSVSGKWHGKPFGIMLIHNTISAMELSGELAEAGNGRLALTGNAGGKGDEA